MLYSIDLEKSVLSSLLSIDDIIATTGVELCEQDFYAGRHQVILRAILALHSQDQSYDVVMVNEYLQSHDLLDDSETILGDLIQNSPATMFSFGHYVERLQALRQRRTVKQALQQALEQVDNMEVDIDEHLNKTLEELHVSNMPKQDYAFTADLCVDFFNQFHAKVKGEIEPFIDTGFAELDNKLMLNNGDLCVIAGRPSMGKSTLAQNILTYITHTTGNTGVFFSLEMPKNMVMERLVSAIGGVSLSTLKSGGKNHADGQPTESEFVGITNAISTLKNLPLVIDDTSGITVSQIRAKLNKIRHKQGKIGVVVVDYIGLMGGIGKDVVNDIGMITTQLKAIAKDFDCPVVALSQLNRGLENRPDKRPRMSDLRDSGKVEQDADQVIGVYRGEYYANGDSKERENLRGLAEAIILKNRNGIVGTAHLGFQGEFSRFVNLVSYE